MWWVGDAGDGLGTLIWGQWCWVGTGSGLGTQLGTQVLGWGEGVCGGHLFGDTSEWGHTLGTRGVGWGQVMGWGHLFGDTGGGLGTPPKGQEGTNPGMRPRGHLPSVALMPIWGQLSQ